MRLLLVILLTLRATIAFAQPAPTVATTVRTTSTAATSVRVGCTQSGSCTGGIVAGPIDVASVTSGGFIGIASNVPANTAMRLYNNAGTLTWNGIVLAAGSSVSGTTGKLSKFTAPNAIGDSICSESGTTITCVNTVSATTLTGTLSTAAQNSVTTMTALATVGTITTGTWNSTKIGLLYGGTNADLSGTGGTSQFLRQNTVGGTITVVRPAISDLSDASNVALLNAANTFSADGTMDFVGTANGLQLIRATTSSTGTAARAVQRTLAGSTTGDLASFSQGFTTSGLNIQASTLLSGDGANGVNIYANHAAGVIGFYTGASSTRKFAVNAAGDWLLASSIYQSVGTPALTTCTNCGTASIAGTDSAFTITYGTTTNNVVVVVTFGHTFTNAPVCVGTNNFTGTLADAPGTTTTTMSAFSVTQPAANSKVSVVCYGK